MRAVSGYTPQEKRDWLHSNLSDALVSALYNAWWRVYQREVITAPRVNGCTRAGDIRKASDAANAAILANLMKESP